MNLGKQRKPDLALQADLVEISLIKSQIQNLEEQTLRVRFTGDQVIADKNLAFYKHHEDLMQLLFRLDRINGCRAQRKLLVGQVQKQLARWDAVRTTPPTYIPAITALLVLIGIIVLAAIYIGV